MSKISQVLCVVLIIELLLDVVETYRSAVLLFKLLVGYSKFSFYQGIVAPGSFSLTGVQDGHLVDAQSAGCCSL